MLDEVNLLNHVWLLALRGDHNFQNFVQMIDGKLKTRTGQIIEIDGLYSYPLSQLNRVYRQVDPTFPGLYTVPDPHPMTILEDPLWRIPLEIPESEDP